MSTKTLSGKVALVTGGSRGIGRAIALRLAQDGAKVVVNFARNEAAAQDVVTTIQQGGGEAIALEVDVAVVAEIQRLFAQTQEHFGRLDILVNNAGTASFGPISDVTEEEFARIFTVNVRGVFFALQEATRHLADNGRIINLSSGITISGSAGGSVYAASKAAVEQFTLSASKELGTRGITVNTVSPGGTETDLLQEVVPQEAQARMAQNSPFGRLGRPDDIADVVAFLASEEARWITGQNLRVNGGAG